jgi:hypothetical protein
MKLTRDLKEFIELLNARHVEYLLIGGWAFGFHAVVVIAQPLHTKSRNCTHVKTFSNRKLDSTLLPGYKPLEGRHTGEWKLEAENLMML